jgi:hypothetical protein
MPPPERRPPTRNSLTRRSVLAASLVTASTGALAGCGLTESWTGQHDEEPSPADAAALRSVAAESLQLGARYDGAIGTAGGQAALFTAIRDGHRAHHAAIGRALAETAAPGSPASTSASGSGTAVKDLTAAERAAADQAAAACVQVSARFAPLVGSIAAARAGHAEALS